LFGCRYAYGVTRAIRAILGLEILIFVKEPIRGGFVDEITKMKEIEKNKI